MSLFSFLRHKDNITPLSNVNLFAEALNALPKERREAALEQIESATVGLEKVPGFSTGLLIGIHCEYPRHLLHELQPGDAVFRTILDMESRFRRMMQNIEPGKDSGQNGSSNIVLTE